MKKYLVLSLLSFSTLSFLACGGGNNAADKGFDNNTTGGAPAPEVAGGATTPEGGYDPHRGEGKWNADNVKIAGLDAAMASKGESIAQTKCTSCHKTTDEKLVGPGWKNVTTRHTPAWIMNFITNPDPMIDKDPELQSQLELCLVRMPNQNLDDNDARAILEFMRKNDGAQ